MELKILYDNWLAKMQARQRDMPVEELRELELTEKLESLNNRVGELTGYECSKCKNRGYINCRSGDSFYVVDCECLKVRKSIRHIEMSGLKTVIETKLFDNFTVDENWQKKIKSLAYKYATDKPDNWFLLCGNSGAGKSHLCTAIVGLWLKQGVQVMYMPYRDVMPVLKRTMLDDNAYSSEINKWRNCKVLYIDDLYKGKITETDPSILFEIIDYRYRNNLKTIISSEKDYEELLSIDEAVASRIFEKCADWKLSIEKNLSKNIRVKDIL